MAFASPGQFSQRWTPGLAPGSQAPVSQLLPQPAGQNFSAPGICGSGPPPTAETTASAPDPFNRFPTAGAGAASARSQQAAPGTATAANWSGYSQAPGVFGPGGGEQLSLAGARGGGGFTQQSQPPASSSLLDPRSSFTGGGASFAGQVGGFTSSSGFVSYGAATTTGGAIMNRGRAAVVSETVSTGGTPTRPGPLLDPAGGEAFVSRSIFLSNLPPEATEHDVTKTCETYGELKKVTHYPSKLMAFVEFYDIRDAEKARTGLKSNTLFGASFEIQYSKPRDDRDAAKAGGNNRGTLYVRPMTSERHFVDRNTLDSYKELFSSFGEVKKVNPNRKREAEKFVEYYDLRASQRALSELNGYNFNGVVLEVQFANHSSKTLNRESLHAGGGFAGSGETPDHGGPYGGRRHHEHDNTGYGASRRGRYGDRRAQPYSHQQRFGYEGDAGRDRSYSGAAAAWGGAAGRPGAYGAAQPGMGDTGGGGGYMTPSAVPRPQANGGGWRGGAQEMSTRPGRTNVSSMGTLMPKQKLLSITPSSVASSEPRGRSSGPQPSQVRSPAQEWGMKGGGGAMPPLPAGGPPDQPPPAALQDPYALYTPPQWGSASTAAPPSAGSSSGATPPPDFSKLLPSLRHLSSMLQNDPEDRSSK